MESTVSFIWTKLVGIRALFIGSFNLFINAPYASANLKNEFISTSIFPYISSSTTFYFFISACRFFSLPLCNLVWVLMRVNWCSTI